MSHDPGPLGDLAANLTGSAAGNYEDRLDDEVSLSDTQGPSGRAADPLGRRDVDEEDAYADDDAPLLERDEDADGAPEL